uniref:Cytochrome b/b6 N-terminal region profile domain-containing protein n=1 Tax=Brassica oleracea TaxID=3712 RepID=A0A3P6GH67_BRAOL|nr:unnamed protein product [Brassica oleracea]
MMVLMMILHVFRVYLTGGFKNLELTWVTGVVLGVLTASFGVTGYSFTLGSNWLLGSQNCNRCT